METTMFFDLVTTPQPIELAYLIGAVGGLIAYGIFNITIVIIEKLVNSRLVGLER